MTEWICVLDTVNGHDAPRHVDGSKFPTTGQRKPACNSDSRRRLTAAITAKMEQVEESLQRFREAIELFMQTIERHVYALLGSDKQPSWHFPTFSGLLLVIVGGIIGCILSIYLGEQLKLPDHQRC